MVGVVISIWISGVVPEYGDYAARWELDNKGVVEIGGIGRLSRY